MSVILQSGSLAAAVERFNLEADLATLLGVELEQAGARDGGELRGRCPSCEGGDFHAYPDSPEGAWAICNRCDLSGDALFWSVVASGDDPKRPGAMRDHLRLRGLLDEQLSPERQEELARLAQRRREEREQARARRAAEREGEVQGLARVCAPAWASAPALDDAAAAWVRSRGLEPEHVGRLDLVRAIAGAALEGERLVPLRRCAALLPLWSLQGELAALQGRGGPGAKEMATKGARGPVVFASSAAVELLKGRTSSPPLVVVVEGGGDWLVWASLRPDLAVLGVLSGSPGPLGARLAELGVPRVAVRTDPDAAGDKYAAQLAAGLPDAELLRPVIRDQGDDGDRFLAGLLEDDPTADCEPWRPSQGQAKTKIRRGSYEVDERGNLWSLRETKDGEQRFLLANFHAQITREVLEDDGASEPVLRFDLEGELGGRSFSVRIPAARFRSMSWVVEELGAGAVVEPGQNKPDLLRHAVQVLSQGLTKRSRVYMHTGWRRDERGRMVYLHAGGAVGASGAVSAEVGLEDPLSRLDLPTPPSGEDLRSAVAASLRLLEVADLRVTYPLLGAVYRAALGVACPFSIYLLGSSGAQKSCLAALAQAHWGSGFSYDSLPGAWSSTANANEAIGFAAKDALFVVDDFRPPGSGRERRSYMRDADRLLRGSANGAGRARLTREGRLRSGRPVRGLVVSTGEELPTGRSLVGRLFVSRLSPGDVKLGPLSELQEAARRGKLAQALAGFLSWLAPRLEQEQEEAVARVADLRAEFLAEGVHPRTPEAAAHLMIGLELFLRFAQEAGALDPVEAKQHLVEARAALAAAAVDQGEAQAEETPVEQLKTILGAAFSSGAAHLVAREGRRPEDPLRWGWARADEGWPESPREPARAGSNPVFLAKGDRIGWHDEGHGELWLIPDATVGVLQKISRGDFLSSARELGVQLREAGLLVSREKKRGNTKRLPRSFCGSRTPCWHVSARALFGSDE